jgi:hypothetical protein
VNFPPIRPPVNTGNDLLRWAREVGERIQTITLQQSTTIQLTPVHGFGTTAEVKQSAIGAGGDTFPQPLHMIFRGEWSNALDYSPGDVVGIYGGTNHGTYVCVTAAPVGSDEPGTAGTSSWAKLSDGFTPNFWE